MLHAHETDQHAEPVHWAPEDFLEEMMDGVDLNTRRILVNGGVVPADYVLQNGDRISATPLKIEGAAGEIREQA